MPWRCERSEAHLRRWAAQRPRLTFIQIFKTAEERQDNEPGRCAIIAARSGRQWAIYRRFTVEHGVLILA